ncbi:MAG TPA: hypothetical protein VFT30_03045 [Nitrospira sp.]|nr:hypothetical protein [Nitrospira sp.]
MSKRDEEIMRGNLRVAEAVVSLRTVTADIKVKKKAQRRLIRRLRKAGLGTRFLAKVSDMSPQTILNISNSDEP